MTYRLLGGAEGDIDRILLRSAREWGVSAADRYHQLMLAVFTALGTNPDRAGYRDVATVAGIRVYPLWLRRHFVEVGQRVGNPRHIVVYRTGKDGVVEIIGLAHDRMLLPRIARRMRREAGPG